MGYVYEIRCWGDKGDAPAGNPRHAGGTPSARPGDGGREGGRRAPPGGLGGEQNSPPGPGGPRASWGAEMQRGAHACFSAQGDGLFIFSVLLGAVSEGSSLIVEDPVGLF